MLATREQKKTNICEEGINSDIERNNGVANESANAKLTRVEDIIIMKPSLKLVS